MTYQEFVKIAKKKMPNLTDEQVRRMWLYFMVFTADDEKGEQNDRVA